MRESNHSHRELLNTEMRGDYFQSTFFGAKDSHLSGKDSSPDGVIRWD